MQFKLIFVLEVYGGLRVKEIRYLTWNNFNFNVIIMLKLLFKTKNQSNFLLHTYSIRFYYFVIFSKIYQFSDQYSISIYYFDNLELKIDKFQNHHNGKNVIFNII